jgi:ABC-type polysaccharide/polyol phosphate export permease
MMPLVFFSEIFFSVDELPLPLARFAAALPSTQLVRMIRAVVLYGERSPSTLATGAAILVGWTVLTFAVSVNRFRWHDQ